MKHISVSTYKIIASVSCFEVKLKALQKLLEPMKTEELIKLIDGLIIKNESSNAKCAIALLPNECAEKNKFIEKIIEIHIENVQYEFAVAEAKSLGRELTEKELARMLSLIGKENRTDCTGLKNKILELLLS